MRRPRKLLVVSFVHLHCLRSYLLPAQANPDNASTTATTTVTPPPVQTLTRGRAPAKDSGLNEGPRRTG